jgi:hypothetical protein
MTGWRQVEEWRQLVPGETYGVWERPYPGLRGWPGPHPCHLRQPDKLVVFAGACPCGWCGLLYTVDADVFDPAIHGMKGELVTEAVENGDCDPEGMDSCYTADQLAARPLSCPRRECRQ